MSNGILHVVDNHVEYRDGNLFCEQGECYSEYYNIQQFMEHYYRDHFYEKYHSCNRCRFIDINVRNVLQHVMMNH